VLDTQSQQVPTVSLGGYLAQRPQWTTVPGDGLEQAVIQVPLDYSDPEGRRLDLAVSRLRATDPARRRGILLAVNGGPGGTDGLGVKFPVSLRDRSKLNEVYDLIGFDPRGGGASTPLNAYVVVPKAAGYDSRPPDSLFPVIAEDMRAREEACQRGGGDMRPHFNTRNIARDMDVIRAVLGEEKINFIGYAFGSVVGAVYGTLFPQRLDRSLLDSCVHPDWTWRGVFLKQAEAIRSNVDAWTAWVAERDGHFGLGATADEVLDAVEAVAAALSGSSEKVQLRTLFDGAVGNDATDRARWAELGYLVNKIREALGSGDDASITELLAGTSTWRPGDQEGELRSGVLEATTLETYWPSDLEEYYADMRLFRERYPYGYGVLRAQPWVGAFRSYEPIEPQTRPRGGYPAGLIVHAQGDSLSNYEGGVAMAERLGHWLVTVADSGVHEVYLLAGNQAADEIGSRYLIDGVLPDQNVVVQPTVQRPPIPADSVAK
jgi:pimeloyl-ACP methyl ester carboxylesterase